MKPSNLLKLRDGLVALDRVQDIEGDKKRWDRVWNGREVNHLICVLRTKEAANLIVSGYFIDGDGCYAGGRREAAGNVEPKDIDGSDGLGGSPLWQLCCHCV